MAAKWRKSTHSGAHQEACVEVAALRPHIVGVRDSKAPEAGHLTFSPESFAALLTRVKRDDLNIG